MDLMWSNHKRNAQGNVDLLNCRRISPPLDTEYTAKALENVDLTVRFLQSKPLTPRCREARFDFTMFRPNRTG